MSDSAESASVPAQAPAAPAALAHSGEPPAWRADLLAGITTGILSVPQGIAFAVIAGVPPIYGLYAMIVPTIVAAMIRSSPFLVTGATNTSALVIGALVATSPMVKSVGTVPLMLLITLLMGLIQVISGFLRLGSFGRFFSQAVLVGFTLGAAALIAVGQIKNVCGLPAPAAPTGEFIDDVRNLISGFGAGLGVANVRTMAIAGLTLLVVIVCARISKLLPGALLGIVISGFAVWALGWGQDPHATELDPAKIKVLGDIPRSLPSFTPPVLQWDAVQEVFMPSLAIAILGMVEAISIGKALSAKARVPFYANQELVAKGGGNIVGAFLGCMPTSASWTRSAINLQMGAKTRWVGVIAGLTVLAIMLAFAPWAHYIPRASLGALIIWIAWHMVDLEAAKYVVRWSRADAAVLVITFMAMLSVKIEYAIYFGVVASLALLVRRAGRLHVVQMVETAPGQYRELEIDEKTGTHPVVLLQLEGDLFFGVVEEMEERLAKIAQNGARAIILRMKRAHAIDATASESLAAFAAHFKASGGRLILCGLKDDLYEQIRPSHLGQILTEENLLRTGDKAFASVQMAIQAAIGHVQQSGDVAPTQTLIRKSSGEMTDAWSYQI